MEFDISKELPTDCYTSQNEGLCARPTGYVGLFAVELDGDETVVFPSYDEAASAARVAVDSEHGGYLSAIIKPATQGQNITHQTAGDWLFS